MSGSVNGATLLAFIGIVVLGGVNGTSIKIMNHELGPFWGATLRFGFASLILFGAVLVRRVPLPRGRQLTGSVLYGLLSFGVTFALVSWALVYAPAGVAQIILALVPLLTLLLAVAQGLERFRMQSLVGSLVAITGVALVFADRLVGSVELLPMLALLAAAFSIAEANVVVKRFPRADPTANNAVAMGAGAVFLFALAVVFGDRLALPQLAGTWLALGYLVVIGSVVVFTLYLYVIARWTASATSYSLLLMPLVAVVVASIALGEEITAVDVAGGVLVLTGVYLGAFAPSSRRPLPGLLHRVPRRRGATLGPPLLETPNCP